MPDPRFYTVLAGLGIIILLLATAGQPRQARFDIEATLVESPEASIGVSVDGDRIDFGTIPVTAESASKKVSVENGGEEETVVSSTVTGNISRMLKVDGEFPVKIPPRESREVTVVLEPSESPGYYTGVLVLDQRTVG